jgi:hypothetical protein
LDKKPGKMRENAVSILTNVLTRTCILRMIPMEMFIRKWIKEKQEELIRS